MALLGVLLFSLLDTIMKAQALAMGTYSAMFWRMVFGMLFVKPAGFAEKIGQPIDRGSKAADLIGAWTGAR